MLPNLLLSILNKFYAKTTMGCSTKTRKSCELPLSQWDLAVSYSSDIHEYISQQLEFVDSYSERVFYTRFCCMVFDQSNHRISYYHIIISRYWLILSQHEVMLTGWKMLTFRSTFFIRSTLSSCWLKISQYMLYYMI